MLLSGLYHLLGNPFYMGIIRLKSGRTYKGAHEPMISPEEFELVQTHLGRPTRPRPSRHEFTYSGLLRCANCRRALIGEVHVKRSGRRFVYYRCHALTGAPRFGEPAVPERILNEHILVDLKRVQLSTEAATWIRDNLRVSLSGELTGLELAGDSRRKALAQAKTEAQKLLDLRLRGLIDDGTFAARHAELRERQVTLEVELEQPKQTPEQLLAKVDSVLAFSMKAPEFFSSAAPVQRRLIAAALCSNPEVRAKELLYTAKKPFSLLADTTGSPTWYRLVDDVRTWFLTSTEYFKLPSLNHMAPSRSDRRAPG